MTNSTLTSQTSSNTFFQWRSLKTRVTLLSLFIFLVGICAMAYYVSRILQEDLQRLLGEQQFSTASIVAGDINQEIYFRLRSLENIAEGISPATLSNADALQSFLENRLIFKRLFNAGCYAIRADGTVIADVPISTGRIGMNVSEKTWMIEALKGKSSIGKPVIGKQLKVPVFTMATPVRDTEGNVIGVLAGVIDLSKPSFLDRITENRYGKTGDYLLIAKEHRLVVTSSDKKRIMQSLPAEGVNPDIDRNIKGFEGYTILVNPLGVEQLASMKGIPSAGWYLAVALPTEEAFAPIHKMQKRMLMASIIITILAGGLTWRLLQRQLTPMLDAVETLSALSDSNLPVEPLPITREDEVGQLIGSFNRLLKTLGEREASLNETKKMLSLFMKHSPIYTFIKEVTPSESRVLLASDNFQQMIGISGSEMLGKTMSELFPAELAAKIVADDWNVVSSGHVLELEEDFNGRNYTTIKFPIVRGEKILLAGYTIDITDRKKVEEERLNLERQLLQAQKMESLGVLAGGIAHDFNNILTSIVGNIELALMRLNPESPVIDNLKRIEKGAIRATDLAKQMLAYSGKGKFVVEAIDLNRLVEEMGHMLEVSISKKAVLRYNLTTPLPSVEADATQIRQIVMNLVINASEAIGDKSGVIAISTGCIHCDSKYLKNVWLNSKIAEGLYVYLEVADTGCGMDKETQSKIFDPFFTTKFTGRGLGMAAVQGIISGHKGAIKVYSELGKGSSFKILLPAGAMPAEQFNEKPDETGFKGEGTVLLVDDEKTVRAIGSEMLKELGFTVISANDGREALDEFKSNPGLYCVILDLAMPHLDGEQTFRELRMLDPDVKVIMSSGYSEYEVTQKFAGKGLAGFIQKPYKMLKCWPELKVK